MPEFYPYKQPQKEDLKRGWVDFHIPCYRGPSKPNDWRNGYTYEFLREGDNVDEHMERFALRFLAHTKLGMVGG